MYLVDGRSDYDYDEIIPVLFLELIPSPRPRDWEWLVFYSPRWELISNVVNVELEVKKKYFCEVLFLKLKLFAEI